MLSAILLCRLLKVLFPSDTAKPLIFFYRFNQFLFCVTTRNNRFLHIIKIYSLIIMINPHTFIIFCVAIKSDYQIHFITRLWNPCGITFDVFHTFFCKFIQRRTADNSRLLQWLGFVLFWHFIVHLKFVILHHRQFCTHLERLLSAVSIFIRLLLSV